MPKEEYEGRLSKNEWYVKEIPLHLAQVITKEYHYAKGGSNTRTYTHGLFRKGEEQCFGIAWWLPPTRSSAKKTYRKNPDGVLSLSRLVILPDVPKNACTFLLSRSVKLIDRKRWPCLVTYADEWRGHLGTIYKAAGWAYKGKTKPQPLFVINGRMTARKAGGYTRTHNEMIALGAVLVGYFRKHKFVLTPKERKGALET